MNDISTAHAIHTPMIIAVAKSDTLNAKRLVFWIPMAPFQDSTILSANSLVKKVAVEDCPCQEGLGCMLYV